MKDGFPFGSILLYEYKNNDVKKNKHRYSLIDVLQRFTTMIDFNENPDKYIEVDEFAEEIARIHGGLSPSGEAAVIRIAKDMILEIIIKDYNNSDEIGIFELANNIQKKLPVLEDPQKREYIAQIQTDAIKFFNNQLDIKNVLIPCIFFEGEESELADVFQRLNRGGKKLSKYQVFAAQWDMYDIKLNHGDYIDKILERVIERYEALNEQRGILIEDFDPNDMRETRTINLSELCYGLGHIIAEESTVFFDEISEDICNELGFQTMLIVFGIPTNKMPTLPDYYKYLKDTTKLEELLTKIIEIYRKVSNAFDRFFVLHMSSRRKKYETKSFTRLQILSFFASLWIVSYNVNFNDDRNEIVIKNIKNKKRETNKVLDNVIIYAIYDAIRSFWSGTGDRKLMDIYINKNNRYIHDLDKSTFKNELFNWNEEMTLKQSVNIQSDEKMILTCIYNHERDFYNKIKDNIDYEHIFARAKYRKHKNKGTISAGALGNIMLLDEGLNRGMKEKYLYDILDPNKVKEPGTIENDYITFSQYPEKVKLDKVETDIIQNNYLSLQKVIRERGEALIERLTEVLYNNKK